jgi:hypothetical protein
MNLHSRRHKSDLPALTCLVLLVLWLSGEASPAEAYVDPGSGSMLLQLLLGGVAGVVVLARLQGHRLATFLRGLFSTEPREKR